MPDIGPEAYFSPFHKKSPLKGGDFLGQLDSQFRFPDCWPSERGTDLQGEFATVGIHPKRRK